MNIQEETNKSEQFRCCTLPSVPERQIDSNIDSHREFLIRYMEKKWVNHTILHFHFLENNPAWQGDNEQKQAVRDAFAQWKALGVCRT